jgi:CRISPR system Cascade subunit CasE
VTTHLLRFDPDMRLASQWMAAEGLASNGQTDEGYGWHAILCAAFGKDHAPKPFRIVARRGRPAQLLAYAPLTGSELTARAAAFADPKAYRALGVDELASKPMPSFLQGRRLGFSLFVRPVVRTDRDGDRAKSREIDAYVHARENGDARDRTEVYLDWARERLSAGGAEVETMRIDGLESVKVMRRGLASENGRPLKAISGHAISIVGGLRVANEARFAEAVSHGVGRHRAFGFGMLLLAPPEG